MMNTTQIIVDLLGWAGSLLGIAAYWLNSQGKIQAQAFSYQFMNVLAGLFLIINTFYYGAYPSCTVNLLWVFIGSFYLIKTNKLFLKVNAKRPRGA